MATTGMRASWTSSTAGRRPANCAPPPGLNGNPRMRGGDRPLTLSQWVGGGSTNSPIFRKLILVPQEVLIEFFLLQSSVCLPILLPGTLFFCGITLGG